MKYKLSFCEIEQLSGHTFEVTIDEGTDIDENCAEEAETFWHNLREESYGLLVNNKNSFSYTFLGAQKIGDHSLERKTAILVNSKQSKAQESTVLMLKEIAGNAANRKLFHSEERDEAIKWLEIV